MDMTVKATSKKSSPGSWLLSFLLHGLIIIVLLITTSKTITSQSGQTPPARIISSADNMQLQEDKPVEQLIMPENLNFSSAELPGNEFPQLDQATLNPIAISGNNPRPVTTAAVPASSIVTKSMFFGTSGDGQRICFLVDVSGSMIMAIEYLKTELINSVSKLTPDQYFQIIFFADQQPISFADQTLTRASYQNRQKAVEFIRQIELQPVSPGTESWRPLLNAIRNGFESVTFDNKPANLIYLFTDGDFDFSIVNPALSNIQNARTSPAIINILLCGTIDNEPYLIDLARRYRGQYKFLTDDQLANPTESHIIR